MSHAITNSRFLSLGLTWVKATTKLLICLFLGAGCLAGCAASSGPEPDGRDAASDDGGPDAGEIGDGADPGSDSGPGDQEQPGDVDLGDHFGLWIPTGMQACATGWAFGGQVDQSGSTEVTGRIIFQPGMVRLYRDRSSFAADLIQQVEWGFDRRIGTPVAEGQFVREEDLFTYDQSFSMGDKTMDIQLQVWFGTSDGTPPPQVITLGEDALAHWGITVGGSVGNASLQFLSCTHTIFDHSVHVYTFGDDDQLKIEACATCPNQMCKNSIGALERAEVRIGGVRRVVVEPLHLSLWFGQHDWYGDGLVYLEEPIGAASGLVFSFGVYPDMPGDEIQLFDRDLQVTSTHPVTRSERRDSW